LENSAEGTVKKVLLLGMGPTALSALESLARQFDVVGIVRSVKVRAKADDDVVVRRAQQLSVPVLTDISLKGVLQAIEELRPHCTVVSSYDRVLSPRILSHGKFVNVHYSALPKYRGRANVNWAILNHESKTAITIHAITSGLDNGNILFQRAIPIEQDDTVTEIYRTLNEVQANVLGETVARYLDGFGGVPQDESESTYGCTRVPADGEIDWSKSTDHIYALIRALSPPYPGAHSYLEVRRITIVRASPVRDGPRYVGRIPGRIVARSRSDGYVDVLTGDGTLRLHEVITDEDGQPTPASGVITSTRQTLGLRSADLLMRINDLERRLSELLNEGK
jgi:methionyl-tRNA formyltransferase